jgi:TRAP-type C4-dicarboxylate transport system permease small subunit
MNKIYRILNRTDNLFQLIGGGLILISTAMACEEVFSRYILHETHSWVEELLIYCILWGVFLTIGSNVRRDAHINIDIVMTVVSNKRIISFLDRCSDVVSGIFCLIWAYLGCLYVMFTREGDTSLISMDSPVMWLVQIPMALGFLLAAIYFLQRFLTGGKAPEADKDFYL